MIKENLVLVCLCLGLALQNTPADETFETHDRTDLAEDMDLYLSPSASQPGSFVCVTT